MRKLALLLVAITTTLQVSAQNHVWYQDYDKDGWGNPSISTIAPNKPAGYVLNKLDCDDSTLAGGEWTTVGNTLFSVGIVDNLSIELDKMQNVYVAFRDNGNGNKPSVMKLVGSTWTYVGSSGLSIINGSNYVDFVIDQTNVPFVVCNDDADLVVKKYDGANWVQVGGVLYNGISGSSGNRPISITCDKQNKILVAYKEIGNTGKLTVKSFDGTNWVALGSTAFTTNAIRDCDIAVDNNNVPYVAYIDVVNGFRPIIASFTGAAWVTVGSGPASTYPSQFPSLTFDHKYNTPYLMLAYSSATGPTGSNYVVRYTGSAWANFGKDFGAGPAIYPSYIRVDSANDIHALQVDYGMGYYDFYDTASDSWIHKAGPIPNANASTLALDSTAIPYSFLGGPASGGTKATVVKRTPGPIKQPIKAIAKIAVPYIVAGQNDTLIADKGTLGHAKDWYWYEGSCGGKFIGRGDTLPFNPTKSATYYVRAEGPCLTTPSTCDSVKVTVMPTSVGSFAKNNVTVYPNPTTINEIEIRINNAEALDYNITVTDVTGKKLTLYSKKQTDGNYIADIHQLLPGLYMLYINDSKGIPLAVTKFIKQ